MPVTWRVSRRELVRYDSSAVRNTALGLCTATSRPGLRSGNEARGAPAPPAPSRFPSSAALLPGRALVVLRVEVPVGARGQPHLRPVPGVDARVHLERDEPLVGLDECLPE